MVSSVGDEIFQTENRMKNFEIFGATQQPLQQVQFCSYFLCTMLLMFKLTAFEWLKPVDIASPCGLSMIG